MQLQMLRKFLLILQLMMVGFLCCLCLQQSRLLTYMEPMVFTEEAGVMTLEILILSLATISHHSYNINMEATVILQIQQILITPTRKAHLIMPNQHIKDIHHKAKVSQLKNMVPKQHSKDIKDIHLKSAHLRVMHLKVIQFRDIDFRMLELNYSLSTKSFIIYVSVINANFRAK